MTASIYRSLAVDLTSVGAYGDSIVTWSSDEPAGTSISVSTSLDGVTYSAATNGSAIPGLSLNDPMYDVWLTFKVTFTGSGSTVPTLLDLTASVSSNPSAGANLDATKNYYKFGYVKWLSGLNKGLSMEVKEWLSASDKVTLFLKMRNSVQVGDIFEITPGCDRSIYTCFNKFDNAANFRGEPYCPGQDTLLRIVSPNHNPLDPTAAWAGAQTAPKLDVND